MLESRTSGTGDGVPSGDVKLGAALDAKPAKMLIEKFYGRFVFKDDNKPLCIRLHVLRGCHALITVLQANLPTTQEV